MKNAKRDLALLFKIFALAYITFSLLIPQALGEVLENRVPEITMNYWRNLLFSFAVITTGSAAAPEFREFFENEVLINITLPDNIMRSLKDGRITLWTAAGITRAGYLGASKCDSLMILLKTRRRCAIILDKTVLLPQESFLRAVLAHEVAHHIEFRMDKTLWKKFIALIPAEEDSSEHFAEIYRQLYCMVCRDMPPWEKIEITPEITKWFTDVFGPPIPGFKTKFDY